ncbi:MAG: geranylgeranylglycerol-phosphate geranylgeranyltransferase [Bacteroidia bacterium]|nr:geranylgeranylglycerol-phosphate geranylgeranyltransferase [Bacteroidia bacterium]MDW8334399.1 geranylgeranylglycerol-phosphate geranylgeranyltransferase [Bacteroidia bacterium]
MPLSIKDGRYLFRLSRPVNILLAEATYAFSAYVSAPGTTVFLRDDKFYVQAAVMAAVMAGGYWINDVFDQKIDRVNKPQKALVGTHISTKKTLTAYWIINLAALAATVWLPFKFRLLNFGAAATLFFYAAHLKRHALWGNLTIAVLTALPVVAGAMLWHFKAPHLWAAVFAFWVNFVREIVKDVEDLRGDLAFGVRTLPVRIGMQATKKFLYGAYALLLALLPVPAAFYFWRWQIWTAEYLAATTVLTLPLWIGCINDLRRATRPEDYGRQSRRLKWLMAAGLFSLFFLPV